jgi:uncharacterized phiE125 gp8 family phage protein
LNSFNLYGGQVPYGTEALTEASPPQSFTEPLTLAEMKSYLKLPEISPLDTEQDDLISSLITAAREQAEIGQHRDLVPKQFDRVHDYWPCHALELRAPLISVDLVKYRDSDGNYTTLVEGTDYIVDTSKQPGIIMPPYGTSWPTFTAWPSSAILIRYTSGYSASSVFWSDAGSRVRNGMRMLIAWWFNNRLPFENATVLSEYPYTVTACLEYGSLKLVG